MHDKTLGLIVVMGVSGSGKSTIGKALADSLRTDFVDGDDLHPETNKQKMSSGISLTDADREPWLAAIRERAERILAEKPSTVVACSALKVAYRQQLRTIAHPVTFIHLHAPEAVIAERQATRTGHFMPPELLSSQYETLESPTGEPNTIEISVETSLSQTLENASRALTALPVRKDK